MAEEIKKTKADKVLKAYNHSRDSFAQSIEDSEKAMRYVNNDSWNAADKANATKHNKPVLKYNIIIPILSTLQGNEQLFKRRARFKPQTMDGVEVCDIMQGRWNALNDEQNIEEQLQVVFMDALITKMGGYIERKFKVNEQGYLDFHYQVANNMRVFIDPETKSHDTMLKTCKWIVKEGWETLEYIQEKYAIDETKTKSEDKIKWWEKITTIFKRISDSQYSSANSTGYDKENDTYKILEMQERVSRRMYKVFDEDSGEYFDIEPKEFSKLRESMPSLAKVREYYEDKIHATSVIPYFENVIVMDEDLPLPAANYDIFPCFSYNFNIQVSESTSLVDLLIDIQDDVNKGKSQARDYVTQILSGGIFVDKREKETIKRLKQKGNQPNQVYELNNPANIPQMLPPGQIPPDVLMNTENSVQYAQRVSLVNEAMRGGSEKSGESGVLFQKKVERAAAAINPYFKNLSSLRKALAQDFVDNFSFVYAEEDRVVNIKDDKNGLFVENVLNLNMAGKILHDVSNVSLFVELDEGNDNITTKEENFEKMLAMVNVIGQVNPQFVDIRTLVANAPIQGKEEMLAYIDNQIQSQAESGQKQQQIDDTRQLLENMKLERGMVTDSEKMQIEREKNKNSLNNSKQNKKKEK